MCEPELENAKLLLYLFLQLLALPKFLRLLQGEIFKAYHLYPIFIHFMRLFVSDTNICLCAFQCLYSFE